MNDHNAVSHARILPAAESVGACRAGCRFGREAGGIEAEYNGRKSDLVLVMATTTTITIHTTPDRMRVIDQAAQALGCSRSKFVLDAAEARAREVLLDQKVFTVSANQYEQFVEVLDQPLPKESQEAITRLLSVKAPWGA